MSPLHCVINLEVFNVDFCSFLIIGNKMQSSWLNVRYRGTCGEGDRTFVLRHNFGGGGAHHGVGHYKSS